MKMKSLFTRAAVLLLTLTALVTICGWIPLTAPVTIHSYPQGAKVYTAGRVDPVGVTPFKTRVFHGTTYYELRMKNFLTEPVEVNFESAKHIRVKLRPRPLLIYTKPAAEIYLAGSDTALGTGSAEVELLTKDQECIVKAPGYQEQRITINRSTDNPLVIELQPLSAGSSATAAE